MVKLLPMIRERFFRHIHQTESCWLWTGATRNGYGVMYDKRRGERKTVYAHRVSFELHIGKIPTTKHILHSCDIKPCVNPAHLSIGTQRQNSIDAIKKRRWGGQILVERQVLDIRSQFTATAGQMTSLAREFGVSISTIWRIVHNKNWRHLLPTPP